MISLGIAALIAALTAAGAGVAGAAINSASQEKTNQANKEMNEANNAANAEAVKQTNEANIAMQKEINSQNIALARETMQFNSAEAQKSREHELMMSNTAVQRRAADLQAAGINPMLAIGDAAQSFSGPSASASSARVQGVQSEAPHSNASRFEDSEPGNALQSLASIAQSAAFMMALKGSKSSGSHRPNYH